MNFFLRVVVIIVCLLGITTVGLPADTPATQPKTPGLGQMPHIQVDVAKKQVRVECEAVRADYGLEFFLCATDTNEYESVLRTGAKPSLIHAALLMIGMKPGEPAKYDSATNKWTPPHGPLVNLECEFQSKGKTVKVPANEMMINTTDMKPSPPLQWMFSGSRIMEDNSYAADGTGSIISVLTSELSVITVKDPGHHGLEDRPLKVNPDVAPDPGTKVMLIISPAPEAATQPATKPDAK